MIIKNFELKKKNLKDNKYFLLYGNNEGLIEETIKEILKPILSKNIYNYEESDILKNIENFKENLLNKSFFENEKLIIIKRISDKFFKIIEEIVSKNIDDLSIILVASNLDKRSKLRVYFEKEKNTTCVPFYEDNAQALGFLAKKFIREKNINISQQLVNIIIDQKDTIIADLFEALDPSNIKTESNKDRVALIIGIEKYDQTPEASFANLDAKYFFDYSRKAFGVSKSNIKLLVDEDANLIKSLGTISKWLPGKIKDGETELIIFFAGHGLASSDGKELYLLSQDSDPDLLERTALSRTELFKQIISLNPKSVTMFLDTCYSGVSRDEETLLASARPVRIVAEEQEIPNNFTIFSASQLDQISSGLKEANHGIFSYYLMKGLEGKADSNQDKKITNGELLAYMDENVSQKASELGRKQNPSLAGDPDKVLMSYR